MYKYKFIKNFTKKDKSELTKVAPYVLKVLESGEARTGGFEDTVISIAEFVANRTKEDKMPSQKQCMCLHIFVSKNLDAINELMAKEA